MSHPIAYIALGSNLGDSRAVLAAAFLRLADLSGEPIRCSSIWSSSPEGCPPGSPDFLNAVVALVPVVGETPESLLAKLQEREREFGRQPKRILNEARILDLDLIAFGNLTRQSAALTLPHPRARLRRFVLAPLAELAPDLVLPGEMFSVKELLSHANGTCERLC